MKTFDVAVIGGGPAGSSTALFLAQQGVSTVLIEKETLPRYKTCGGGLVGRGRKLIPFDISAVVEREFHQVDVYFSGNGAKLSAKRDKPIINMVMRDAFDHLIIQKAAEQGLTLLQNHTLLGIQLGDKPLLQTSQGEISTRFVIAADGALSPTAKMAGWQESRTIIPAIEYEMEVPPDDFERLSQTVRFDIDAIPYGYGWCFPKKNHLSIGLGIFKKHNSKLNFKTYLNHYLKQLGISEITHQTKHGFVIPITPRQGNLAKDQVFLTGDAAGFADPITAEGISNAIYSGILAANAIIDSQLVPGVAETLYQQALNNTILAELKAAGVLSNYFYEKKPLRDMAIKFNGSLFCERLTDIFMGDKGYPKDYETAIKNRLKALPGQALSKLL
jgi:geranylgeranyl reductase family protein